MLGIFEWDTEFDTGIEQVDAQHRRLIEIINNGVQLCVSDRKILYAEVEALKNALVDYTVHHFSCEEEIMEREKVDSRHITEHIAIHKSFVQAVSKQFEDMEALQQRDKLAEVAEYLIRWLAYHILNTDKSLASQLVKIASGVSPAIAWEEESKKKESSSEPLLKALKALFLIVSEKNQELEKANAILEEKVRQRTKDLEEANVKLQELSVQDELTKLPNRRFALHTLEQLVDLWQRYKTEFALMFVDVDKFKPINDTHGHEKGDYILKWMAEFLRSNFRKTDLVCRFGGDEFLVLLPESDKDSAEKAAKLLQQRVAEQNAVKAIPFWNISLSIGIAHSTDDCFSVDVLIRRADDAMYRVKKAGGGSVACV